MDCLVVIFEVRYEFLFLYDHIIGHTKNIEGGLDVTEMNIYWGGGVMRTTLIKDKIYLGQYHDPENPSMFKVGEKQTLVYESEAKF